MKRLSALLAALTSACAHTQTASPPQDPCSTGVVGLHFVEAAATFRPVVRQALRWPAEAAEMCNVRSVAVVGLPMPSPDSLEGRRAQTVKRELADIGLGAVTFELGDADDQAHPVIALDAAP